MDIEIELKLLATAAAGQDIEIWLANNFPTASIKAPSQLINYYYDTPDRRLRQHDMGLRIRDCAQVFEQTIKTKGTTVGGVHQRPEYNVTLPQPVLDLSLFDTQIWPSGLDVSSLQNDVEVMFITTFTRQVFLVELVDGSQVEIVFDLGQITTSLSDTTDSAAICEIELELKHGSATALFELAKQICLITPVRFGNLSKAARGYHLVDGRPDEPKKPDNMLPIRGLHNIEETFSFTLEQGLGLWQSATARYFETLELTALSDMLSAIKLLNYTLVIYQAWLNEDVLQPIQAHLVTCHQEWQWLETALAYNALCIRGNPCYARLSASELDILASEVIDLQASERVLAQLGSSGDILLQLEVSQLIIDKTWWQSTHSVELPLVSQVKAQFQGYLDAMDLIISDSQAPFDNQLESLDLLLTLQLLWGDLLTKNNTLAVMNWWQRFAGTDDLGQLHTLYLRLNGSALNNNDPLKLWCANQFTQLVQKNVQAMRYILAN
jgi:inorganic triphosphatase YgiF